MPLNQHDKKRYNNCCRSFRPLTRTLWRQHMLEEARTENQTIWLDDRKAILPIMTALFVDGLGPVQSQVDSITPWFQKLPSTPEGVRIFRMPVQSGSPASISESAPSLDTVGKHRLHIPAAEPTKSPRRHAAVRLLISGISHHFNNLLMGIWGNATLIRMQLAEDDPLFERMRQMERLIQSGAFLIHMVLGYLGERRSIAKRIRLNQLIMEIKNEIHDRGGEDDAPWNFEARLKWASRVQRPRMIASSTARVLEVLFQGIGAHCNGITRPENCHAHTIVPKMETISELVTRGLDIIHQLRLYAGDLKTRVAPIQLDAMVSRLVGQIQARYPRIRVTCDIDGSLPIIHGDSGQLSQAISELISNAAAAMSEDGHLTISARTLYPRALKGRCADQFRREFVVIGIKDNGHGIGKSVLKRMFEPFFAHPQQHGKKGLGLAAVDGVMAIHNGYIQVQTEHGIGSTLRLHLPVAAKGS